MRMLKIILLSSFAITQISSAEEIKCTVITGDVPEITTTLTIKPKFPPFSGGRAYLYANVENNSEDPSDKLKDEYMVERVRKADYTLYRDQTIGILLQLTIPSKIENPQEFMGNLILYQQPPNRPQGYGLERRYENMTCSFDGEFFPKVAPCPKPEALYTDWSAATIQGTPKDIERLLRCGADVNYKDKFGCSAFLRVSDTGCGNQFSGPRGSLFLTDIIKLLIEEGANLEDRDPISKRTPLLNFVYSNSVTEVNALRDAKPNINAQDKDGNTALIYAAQSRNELMVRTILRMNPQLDLKNNQGLTAYTMAEKKGYAELLELLTPVAAVETITGNADGTCSPTMVHIYKDKTVEIVLSGRADKMFMLTAPDLGIELMTMGSAPVKQKITPLKTGTFPFSCGIHGAPQQTQGSFMVM